MCERQDVEVRGGRQAGYSGRGATGVHAPGATLSFRSGIVEPMAEDTNGSTLNGFVLGGLTFLVGSYVMHCKYKLGPWPCQKNTSGRRRRSCR